MHLINFYGSNGTGKSTRTYWLFKFLETKYKKHPIFYKVKNKSNDTYGHGQCGWAFENGWAFLGKERENGWIGVDTALLPTHEDRFDFFRNVASYNNQLPFTITHVLVEGYFNSRGPKFSPDNFRKECPNLEKCDFIIMFYDKIEDFITRTNGRTGDNRGMDWALNSAGWRDNQDRADMLTRCLENNSMNDFVTRLDINAPRDWLIQHYFGETFDIEQTKKVNSLF